MPSKLRGFFLGFIVSLILSGTAILTSLYLLSYRPKIKELASLPPLETTMTRVNTGVAARSGSAAAGDTLGSGQQRATGSQQTTTRSSRSASRGETMDAPQKSGMDMTSGSRARRKTRRSSGLEAMRKARRSSTRKSSALGRSRTNRARSGHARALDEGRKASSRRSRAAFPRNSAAKTRRGPRGPAVNPREPGYSATEDLPGDSAYGTDESMIPPETAAGPATGGAAPPPATRRNRSSSQGSADPSNFLNALMQGAQSGDN
jgi:hypothetical protein